MRIDDLSSRGIAALVLLAAACGPGSLASEGSELGDELGESGGAGVDSGEADSGSGDSGESGGPTTTTTETDGDEGRVFVPDATCGGGFYCTPSCQIEAQDCPEGEKCVAYEWGAGPTNLGSKCVPVLGEAAAGEACTLEDPEVATDDCDEDSFCYAGRCRAFCDFGEGICPEGQGCLAGPKVCVDACAPGPEACPSAGEACYFLPEGGEYLCLSVGERELGQPCGWANDCAPGMQCIDAEFLPDCQGTTCCTRDCDPAEPETSCAGQPGTICAPTVPDHGVCVDPESI